jgi:hypothetical protein
MSQGSDLQELFARLKAQNSSSDSPSQRTDTPSIWAQPQQQSYQQPSVSSPLFSPPVQTPNPVHSSNVISPASGTPAPDQQRTSNLLNLLKFNNQSSQSGAQASPLANLQNVGGSRSASQSSATAGATSNTQQDFLLNLLRKPNAASKPSPSPTPAQAPPAPDDIVPSIEKGNSEDSIDRLAKSFATASMAKQSSPSPVRQFGSATSREHTPFDAPQPASKPTKFSYANPFDQLHASSPLNRTPKPEAQAAKKMEILKHDRDVSIAANGSESAAPPPKTRKLDTEPEKSSVSEALEGVGEKVDEQVQQILAKATEAADKATPVASEAQKSGATKNERGDDDDVESSWESAEDSANDKKGEYKVKVYNFPMKPFVSITIKGQDDVLAIRQDDFMVVAKIKKEFDQMDRSLVTASQSHIVYAQTATKKDNCGFRIIRQDTGDHKQVFRTSGERIFSVQLCSSAAPGSDIESVLGTGVNGSVFWTSLAKSRPELFAEDDVEAQGFIMPAVATPEENTSGSPVKTRAKCSSRNPEVFALARSKTISIISPDTVREREYCDATTRTVNSKKYFADHGLRINTGKAGKDFAFSEDDTVIASLDKSGVVKFWDVKDLVSRAKSVSAKHPPVELKEPVWSLMAAASGSKTDDKPSVSSVMLLDKERPHSKGVALRYMLVGFKQNHILQLWDLGLGKAVQELRLPHEKDSDGFCSINYHAKTGIIAIGHPTRNSIYFVHLSAPKYNIPLMDQARYISLLAKADPSLPKPESTAIMSGLREFAFGKVGELRSVDMLKVPVENAAEKGSTDETLFELYVVHSKGVVGIPIKRADLGWDASNKMMEPVDGLNAGVISVGDLRLPVHKENTAPVAAVPEPASKSKEIKKSEPAPTISKPADVGAGQAAPPVPATNGTTRTEPVQAQSRQIPEAPSSTNPPLMTADSYAMAAKGPEAVKAESLPEPSVPVADELKASVKPERLPDAVTADGNLDKYFDSLYRRLDNDKRVSEASSASTRDAMLRLVSATLTENVEQSLDRIISSSIQDKVIPAISDISSKAIDRKLTELLPNHISTTVQREVKSAIPNALQHALKDQQLHRTISEQVAQKVQIQVSGLLQQSLPSMATTATQKMVNDLETRTNQRLQQATIQQQQANAQINQLTSMVRSLSDTIQQMSDSQKAFQEQILALQRERSSETTKAELPLESEKAPTYEDINPQQAAEHREVEEITQLLMASEYEKATIQVSSFATSLEAQ